MWKVFGASVEGTSHLKSGLPCQDAHGYRLFDTFAVAAVADGLGAATKSAEGSHLAVQGCLGYLEEALQRSKPITTEEQGVLLRQAFLTAREGLVTASLESGSDLREYGTTLLVVVATDEWFGIGQIGDGAIVALDEVGTLCSLSPVVGREFVNEVLPLTAENVVSEVFIDIRLGPIKAIALLSDGLELLSIDFTTKKPLSSFFTPIFEGICLIENPEEASQKLSAFLSSDRVGERTDDDKTLVVVGRCTET